MRNVIYIQKRNDSYYSKTLETEIKVLFSVIKQKRFNRVQNSFIKLRYSSEIIWTRISFYIQWS